MAGAVREDGPLPSPAPPPSPAEAGEGVGSVFSFAAGEDVRSPSPASAGEGRGEGRGEGEIFAPASPPASSAAFLPQEIIRKKRLGDPLSDAAIAAFVQGIAQRRVSDAQAAAFAMAVCWRGMTTAECVALTRAMRDSGRLLQWQHPHLNGPVVDKHSTGGVGDTVSLVLGPMLAACGCYVPMVSGRGLGHTGGTLDKLEAIPGYNVHPGAAQLRRVVREAGVAIIGAGPRLAPADARLYAIRDVTATVESVPLITASILAKKLAAGLQALVLDVKYGNGAFMPSVAKALELARSLVDVGAGAGLPTLALLSDMNQPLAPCAGNALEVQLALDMLRGEVCPPRLHEVTLALGEVLLVQAGMAADAPAARTQLQRALDSGRAAERFASMVAGLGGPTRLFEQPHQYLPQAPVVCDVEAGVPPGTTLHVQAIDTRALGLVVVQLGGGRTQGEQRIDAAVGLSTLLPLAAAVQAGTPLARVHARTHETAQAAVRAVRLAYRLGVEAPAQRDVVAGRLPAPAC